MSTLLTGRNEVFASVRAEMEEEEDDGRERRHLFSITSDDQSRPHMSSHQR